jgi:hypothetical protein
VPRQRPDQEGAPAGPRGAGGHRFPGADESRAALCAGRPGEWTITFVRKSGRGGGDGAPAACDPGGVPGAVGARGRPHRPGGDARDGRRAGGGLPRGSGPRPGRGLRLALREEGQADLEEPRRLPGRLHPQGLRGPQGIRVGGGPGAAPGGRGRAAARGRGGAAAGRGRAEGPRGGRARPDRRLLGLPVPRGARGDHGGRPGQGELVRPEALPQEPPGEPGGGTVPENHPRHPHHRGARRPGRDGGPP